MSAVVIKHCNSIFYITPQHLYTTNPANLKTATVPIHTAPTYGTSIRRVCLWNMGPDFSNSPRPPMSVAVGFRDITLLPTLGSSNRKLSADI